MQTSKKTFANSWLTTQMISHSHRIRHPRKSGKKTIFGMSSRKKSKVSQPLPSNSLRLLPAPTLHQDKPPPKPSRVLSVVWPTSLSAWPGGRTIRLKRWTTSWRRRTARGSCWSTPSLILLTSCTSKWTTSTTMTVKVRLTMKSWRSTKWQRDHPRLTDIINTVVGQRRGDKPRDSSQIGSSGPSFSKKTWRMTLSLLAETIPSSFHSWRLRKRQIMRRCTFITHNSISSAIAKLDSKKFLLLMPRSSKRCRLMSTLSKICTWTRCRRALEHIRAWLRLTQFTQKWRLVSTKELLARLLACKLTKNSEGFKSVRTIKTWQPIASYASSTRTQRES